LFIVDSQILIMAIGCNNGCSAFGDEKLRRHGGNCKSQFAMKLLPNLPHLSMKMWSSSVTFYVENVFLHFPSWAGKAPVGRSDLRPEIAEKATRGRHKTARARGRGG
jgi:hypothetical protein